MTFQNPYAGSPSGVKIDNEAFDNIIKETAESKSGFSYSPIDQLHSAYTDNVESFRFSNPSNPNPYIAGNEFAYEGRARNQSGLRLLGNSTAQFFLGELVGGTISGMGTLSRPDKWVERVLNTDDAFTPTLIEKLGDDIMKAVQERFPIYQTKEAQKGMAFTDASWYASMAPSVASALSILIPARAASYLPTKIASALSKSGKIAKAARMSEEALQAGRVVGEINSFSKAEQITDVIASSIAGRVIDSTRESLNKYNEYYQENRANGMSMEEAQSNAADAAARGFRMSHANIVFDLVEWSTILKMGNYAKKGYVDSIKRLLFKDARYAKAAMETGAKVSNPLKGLALDLFKTGLSEGADEMTMDMFQNEGKYQHDVEKGLVEETTLGERLATHISTRKNWDSFIGGVFGGVAMFFGGKGFEKIANKSRVDKIKEYTNNIILNAEAHRKTIDEISAALEEGDHQKATILKDNLIQDGITKAYANGTLDYTIEMFENATALTPDQLKEQGIHPSFAEFGRDIVSTLKDSAKIYGEEMNKVRLTDKDGNVDPVNFALNLQIARLKSEMNILQKRSDEYEQSDEYITAKQDLENFENKFGSIGKEYLDTLITNSDKLVEIEDTIKIYNEAIVNINKKITDLQLGLAGQISNTTKFLVNSQIQTYQATIDEIKDEITRLGTERTKKDEENKLSLKAFEGVDENGNKLLDDSTKKSIEDHFENTIKQNRLDTFNKVSAYKARLKVAQTQMNFFLSKEGIDLIRKQVEEYDSSHIADTTSMIEDEVKDMDESQLKAAEKKYAKVIDKSIYKPIIDRRLKEERTKAKLAEQQKARDDAASNDTSNDTATNPAANRSPSVPGQASQTATNSSTSKSIYDISLRNSEQYKAAIKRAMEEAETLASEDVLQLGSHIIKLLDIFLNRANRDLLFDQEFDKKNKTLSELYFETLDIVTPTTTFDQFAKVVLDFATELSNAFYIQDSNNEVGFELIGVPDAQIDYTKFIDALNDINPNIYKNVKSEISSYFEVIDSKQNSNILFGLQDTSNIDDEIVNTFSENYINELSEMINSGFNSYADELAYANGLLKRLVSARLKVLKAPVLKITKEDVLKYLRDLDVIYDRYDDVFNSLKSYKSYILNNISNLENKISKLNPLSEKHKSLLQALNKELAKNNTINNLLDIDPRTVITEKIVDQFLKTNPKNAPQFKIKTGVKAVLNIYDKDGNPVEIHPDDTIDSEDKNILSELNNITPGTNVVYEIDSNYRYEGAPETYDWGTQPIKVKVVTSEGVSESTVLFIRSLEYISSGIQYGRKVKNDYEFHGITEVLNENDYQHLADNIQTIKEFYYNYRQSFATNVSERQKEEHKKKAREAYNKLRSDEGTKGQIERIINHNRDMFDQVSATYDQFIGFYNSIFYGINTEDIMSYYPTKGIIKAKINDKEKALRNDFENTRALRSDIHNGIVTESKIGYVSTPSVLVDQDTEETKNDPHPTIDTVVKPITLEGETIPRIVFIRTGKNGKYYDLQTGNEIKDSRFDSNKYAYRNFNKNRFNDPIRVLLQAPNGQLVPFDVNANTINRSYVSDEHRTKAVDFVFKTLDSSLSAGTREIMSATLSRVRHIVINDDESVQNNTTVYKDFKFLSSFISGEESRITVATKHGRNDIMFNAIVFKDGKISIYRSTFKEDVEKRRFSKKHMSEDDLNIDISTPEGYKLYETKFKSIIGNMFRQSHIDLENNKFTFDQKYKGGEVVESDVTGETYENALDYYIKTGSLYTRAAAIYDDKGDIVTNFDIKGKYPLTVTLESSSKPMNDYTVKSVSEVIGFNKPIDKNDPYKEFILMLEESVSPYIGDIIISSKEGSSSRTIATTRRHVYKTRKSSRKFDIIIHSPYFNVKFRSNPYMPASLNFAHEFLHVYMNKRYLAKANETEEERNIRQKNIKYHNDTMILFYNDLVSAWNSSNKTEVVMNALGINETEAHEFINGFEEYLKHSKKEVDKVLAFTDDQILGHEDTIQEPITYAFSNPAIALILNNIDAGIKFKSPRKNSFWNLLLNKFLSILKRLFGSDIKLSESSQLAKLTNIVGGIFDAKLRQASEELAIKSRENVEKKSSSKSDAFVEKAKVAGQIKNEDDTAKQIDIKKLEEGIERSKSRNRDINIELPNNEDFENDDFQEANILTPNDLSMTETSLNMYIVDEEERIVDGLNIPIC